VANYRAVFAVGNAIAQHLQNIYPPELSTVFPCQFRLVSSQEIASEGQNALDQAVSIFLHRITINQTLRSATRLDDAPNRQPVLFLELHYLVTYWGGSAEAEQTVMAWTMQQLQMHPVIDNSILPETAEFGSGETVQLLSADLSLEDILRIWDALGPKYRLSLAYIARVVRIDRAITPELPIVASSFTFQRPEVR
jgi:hypothetical protein